MEGVHGETGIGVSVPAVFDGSTNGQKVLMEQKSAER